MVNPALYINATASRRDRCREWFTCTSRCSSHTATCPVPTVTWTVDGFSKCPASHCTRSETKTATGLANDTVLMTVCVSVFMFQTSETARMLKRTRFKILTNAKKTTDAVCTRT